jgi:hypothetical protein
VVNYTIPLAQSAGNETITTYPKEAIWWQKVIILF